MHAVSDVQDMNCGLARGLGKWSRCHVYVEALAPKGEVNPTMTPKTRPSIDRWHQDETGEAFCSRLYLTQTFRSLPSTRSILKQWSISNPPSARCCSPSPEVSLDQSATLASRCSETTATRLSSTMFNSATLHASSWPSPRVSVSASSVPLLLLRFLSSSSS